MIDTLRTANDVIKNTRRQSFGSATAIHRVAARETLRREKKRSKKVHVIKETEASRMIISHAKAEAKKLLDSNDTSPSSSISRKATDTVIFECTLE